ncbi:MAG TPA: hypothetical protein VM888_11695 [Chitinophagaceae bacterium]|nr:hypothetical protein [Chitinophagaceae bacterium]
MFAFAVISVQAQASNKLYGYSQIITPGVRATADVDMDGNVIKKPVKTNYDYSIYLTTALKTKVYPLEVWIKGNAYSAKIETIAHTPVEHTNSPVLNQSQKNVLVPKTTQKVVKLIPTAAVAIKSTRKVKQLAKSNELVVVYKQGGKTYYKTIKKFMELEPLSLQ